MNKLVHFEVTFKLLFHNFDFFQRNIILINKVSPLDIYCIQPCSVRLRIVGRPSCHKRQLMGHFPDLWYRLLLGRGSGCKNFCLKPSSRKWGYIRPPLLTGRGADHLDYYYYIVETEILKNLLTVSKYQACYC